MKEGRNIMDSYNVTFPNQSSISLNNCDCFDFIETLCNGEIDIVFTSPPYNRKRNDKYSCYNDTLDDYYSFLCKIVDSLICKVNKYIFLNVQSNYYNKADVYRFIGKYADKIQQVFIWEKSNPMPAQGNNITNAYEYFIVIGNKSLKSNTTYTKNILTTSVNSQTNTAEHKAVMKQEVADWFIENFTKEDDIIYDPFMGLGTTAISCKKFGRKCIGTELINKYYLYSIGNLEAYQINYEKNS